MAPKTTTTSFALLGLLAIGDSTAYELTQQMRRAVRLAWPRSEANLYGELKRLEALGFVSTSTERTGQRSRTRYHITPEGRAALERWFADTTPAPPKLEFETALRLFLADRGTPDDLRRALEATREHVREMAATGIPIIESYLEGAGPYPERFHLNMWFALFLARFYAGIVDWCDEVEADLDRWPGTAGVGETPASREAAEETLRIYRRLVGEG